MRWYSYTLLGVAGGLGALHVLNRSMTASLRTSFESLLGGKAGDESARYVRIEIPLKISDMAVDAARSVADALEPQSVTPIFTPPALDFRFKPIVIQTEFISFRWQPPPYRKRLTGEAAKPSRITSVARRAQQALYRTEVRKLDTGWELILIGEIPI